MQVGISDQERDALVAFLREHIDKDRFTRSSRFQPLKTFLSKLEPYRGTPVISGKQVKGQPEA